jgi:hypothetical protein
MLTTTKALEPAGDIPEGSKSTLSTERRSSGSVAVEAVRASVARVFFSVTGIRTRGRPRAQGGFDRPVPDDATSFEAPHHALLHEPGKGFPNVALVLARDITSERFSQASNAEGVLPELGQDAGP